MRTYLLGYVATAGVFLALDFVWLSSMSNLFYRPKLGALLADQPNFVAAVAFYLLYVAGILYFAVLPSVSGGNWASAALAGALLGLFAYATYDLTNMATLRGWSVTITIVDIVWGMIVTGAAAAAGYLAITAFANPARISG